MKTNSVLLATLILSTTGGATGAHAKGASADEAAIQQVIQTHVAAFHARETEKNLSFWVKAPYVSHSYNDATSGYVRGFDKLDKVFRAYVARHPEPTKGEHRLSDFIYRVNGKSAWVTFVQDIIVDSKRKSGTFEARYMEKVAGNWKIVAVVAKNADPDPPKAASAAPASPPEVKTVSR